jgi:L-alanine-DL-glutamate epimerase-like enolase superfamily enzyme
MKIINVKCAMFGSSPVIRVITDEGVDGYSQVEWSLPDMHVIVPMFQRLLIGEDPTDIEKCMLKIRPLGGFKPWGSVVSALNIALYDVTGKYFGVPVYKLLGGKVRDKVRVYNGGVRPSADGAGRDDYATRGSQPEDYASRMKRMKAAPERFTIIKEGVAYHDFSTQTISGLSLSEQRTGAMHPNRGPLTERGLTHIISCAEAMKDILGSEVGLALDMGPGLVVADAIRIMRALEPLNLMWGEDILSGNFTPWVHVSEYIDLTRATSTPTHTGEQIYLRHNFRELISRQAVRMVGPEMLDVGGISEIKWIAEYADLFGIQIAPHGVHDGLFGLAALVQVCSTMPDNFIAFEYPVPEHDWWYDIVIGLPDPIVKDGFIDVGEAPGLGLEFDKDRASTYLVGADHEFFE